MTDRHIEQTHSKAALPIPVRRAVEAALEKKALDVVVLDLKKSGAFTDHFALCSGRTGRQVKAIVDEIIKKLRENGSRPSHVEGYDLGEWVLIDCFDFVVHVFTQDTRRFYDLERLWGSAERFEFSDV